MEREFIPYELALRMNQLGFNEMYDTKAPLYQQAFRWFREKYFYISYVCTPYKEHNEFYFRIRHIGDVINEGQLESCESQVYNTYEEAELACLEKLIEILESKSE